MNTYKVFKEKWFSVSFREIENSLPRTPFILRTLDLLDDLRDSSVLK